MMDVTVAVPNPAGQAAAVIWTTDRALRFTSFQGGALKAFGSRGEDFVGTSLFEFFHTEDSQFPPIAAHLRPLADEGEPDRRCIGFPHDAIDRVDQVFIPLPRLP